MHVPGRSPIEETAAVIKNVDKALDIFKGLWERQAQFDDEVAPPGFEDAVREAWSSIIEDTEY